MAAAHRNPAESGRDEPPQGVRPDSGTLRRWARVAGAAYLLTNATSLYSFLVIGPQLRVAGDVVATTSRLAAHTSLFRSVIILDLLTIAGCAILNVALYELLARRHAGLARLGWTLRTIELAVYAASTMFGFLVLSLVSGADYLSAFGPGQIPALVRLSLGARAAGFWVAMWFLVLGSLPYFVALLRTNYIPRWLTRTGLIACALSVVALLIRWQVPAWFSAAQSALLALPLPVLIALGIVVVPLFAFEFTIGGWLLFRGVDVADDPCEAPEAAS